MASMVTIPGCDWQAGQSLGTDEALESLEKDQDGESGEGKAGPIRVPGLISQLFLGGRESNQSCFFPQER